jgi:hypothetical protein
MLIVKTSRWMIFALTYFSLLIDPSTGNGDGSVITTLQVQKCCKNNQIIDQGKRKLIKLFVVINAPAL